MTVKDLKEKLQDAPDDMQVLIPGNAAEGFDGMWFSPCVEESDIAELGLEDIDEEEAKERQLLNKPEATEKSFILVPCGFFDENKVQPQHN